MKIGNTNEHDTFLYNIRQEKVHDFIEGNHSDIIFMYNALFVRRYGNKTFPINRSSMQTKKTVELSSAVFGYISHCLSLSNCMCVISLFGFMDV